MTPDYSPSLYRLYANPLKLVAWLAIAITCSALATVVLAHPDSHLDFWSTSAFWVAGIIAGLGALAFVAQLLLFCVARRPVLEITQSEWRFYPLLSPTTMTRMAWADVARVGAYRQRNGWMSTYALVVMPRSEKMKEAERELGSDEWLFPSQFSSRRERIELTFAFLRVTPERCERLLADIQSTCASETARYGVHIETTVLPMW